MALASQQTGIQARRNMRFSADMYEAMIDKGILTSDDRVELLEGCILEMNPIGNHHVALLRWLHILAEKQFGNLASIFSQVPVRMGDHNEPQPDIIVARNREDDYVSQIPQAADVMLLIEISDSTYLYDRDIKRLTYAKNLVPEYWIVVIERREIEIYREPENGDYNSKFVKKLGDQIAPLAFTDLPINITDCFPPAMRS